MIHHFTIPFSPPIFPPRSGDILLCSPRPGSDRGCPPARFVYHRGS
jgi:hypothetical protein